MTLITKAGKPWGGQICPHAVYRMYAADGELLYIGCTVDISTRFRNHMHNKSRWIHQVARIDLEWHPDFATAREAEGRAIATEAPRYNIDGMPRGHGVHKGPQGGPLTPEAVASVAHAAIQGMSETQRFRGDPELKDRLFIAIVRALAPRG